MYGYWSHRTFVGKFTLSEASPRQAPMEKTVDNSGKLCRNSNLFSVRTCTESAGHMNQVTRPPIFRWRLSKGVFFWPLKIQESPPPFWKKSTDFNSDKSKKAPHSMCVLEKTRTCRASQQKHPLFEHFPNAVREKCSETLAWVFLWSDKWVLDGPDGATML